MNPRAPRRIASCARWIAAALFALVSCANDGERVSYSSRSEASSSGNAATTPNAATPRTGTTTAGQRSEDEGSADQSAQVVSNAARGSGAGGDPDGDGILSSSDLCPSEPEDRDGFQDSDGCPDPDNDQDGIRDANDRCPNDPEDRDGYQDDDGCPDGP